MHAHWNGFAGIHPARSWEHETFLSYGVTTLHKYVESISTAEPRYSHRSFDSPSASSVLGYNERFRMESGQMIGPRIFQTGEGSLVGCCWSKLILSNVWFYSYLWRR
jgi:hypothetical protein